jgi:hypothetical protein
VLSQVRNSMPPLHATTPCASMHALQPPCAPTACRKSMRLQLHAPPRCRRRHSESTLVPTHFHVHTLSPHLPRAVAGGTLGDGRAAGCSSAAAECGGSSVRWWATCARAHTRHTRAHARAHSRSHAHTSAHKHAPAHARSHTPTPTPTRMHTQAASQQQQLQQQWSQLQQQPPHRWDQMPSAQQQQQQWEQHQARAHACPPTHAFP